LEDAFRGACNFVSDSPPSNTPFIGLQVDKGRIEATPASVILRYSEGSCLLTARRRSFGVPQDDGCAAFIHQKTNSGPACEALFVMPDLMFPGKSYRSENLYGTRAIPGCGIPSHIAG
jgi:hypothetical protein